jgi:hypothetical protein
MMAVPMTFFMYKAGLFVALKVEAIRYTSGSDQMDSVKVKGFWCQQTLGLYLFLKATNPISCHFLHDFNVNGTGMQPLLEMNCTVIVRMAV